MTPEPQADHGTDAHAMAAYPMAAYPMAVSAGLTGPAGTDRRARACRGDCPNCPARALTALLETVPAAARAA